MERNNFERLWTVREVATYLNLSEKAIRNRVLNRSIPYVKVGRSVRFRPADIESYVIPARQEAVA